jgi:hypothetical protein
MLALPLVTRTTSVLKTDMVVSSRRRKSHLLKEGLGNIVHCIISPADRRAAFRGPAGFG